MRTDYDRTPEQRARAAIDAKLEQAGWRVQSMTKIDFGAGTGVAVREYPTDVGPADYVLFIDSRAVGKTYTAITAVYRLLKHADAKRILFLVDNVGIEVYVVETEKTQHGGQIRAGSVEKRERLTRRKRWEIQDEDRAYSAKERVLSQDHLQGGQRPEVTAHAVPQRLLPAHRRDRGHDRHRHRREAARMPWSSCATYAAATTSSR